MCDQLKSLRVVFRRKGVDGDVRRWMRARLAEGSFSSLRLVSWTDTSGIVNFLPVVEPRPPMLDRVEVFYTHTSPAVDAELSAARTPRRCCRWSRPAPTTWVAGDGEILPSCAARRGHDALMRTTVTLGPPPAEPTRGRRASAAGAGGDRARPPRYEPRSGAPRRPR